MASTSLSTHKVLLRTRRGDAQRCLPQREAVWRALARYAKVGELGAVAVFRLAQVGQPQVPTLCVEASAPSSRER